MVDVYLEDYLEDFLSNDSLSKELQKYLFKQSRLIRRTLYRGLSFPIKNLVIGDIVEEWGGCTHWTYEEGIALDFASDCCDDGEVPVVLYSSRLKGFDLSTHLQDTELYDEYAFEEEVVIVGNDFKILLIHEEMADGQVVYYVKVKPIKRKR